MVDQNNSGACFLVLMSSTRMMLITILVYLWGMGMSLQEKAGAMVNTGMRFEKYIQKKFSREKIPMTKIR